MQYINTATRTRWLHTAKSPKRGRKRPLTVSHTPPDLSHQPDFTPFPSHHQHALRTGHGNHMSPKPPHNPRNPLKPKPTTPQPSPYPHHTTLSPTSAPVVPATGTSSHAKPSHAFLVTTTMPTPPPTPPPDVLFTREDSPTAEGSSHDVPPPPTTRDRLIGAFHQWVPVRTTYERLHNGLATGRMQLNRPGRFIGLGTDGVFRNLLAKPELEDDRHRELHPPTYEEAAADALPEYWELTVISPIYDDEVFVEGLPVGNIANLVWNVLVAVAFQFVGFVLCYLLHTLHAAKQGARAGLGVTFVIFGYKRIPANRGLAETLPERLWAADPWRTELLGKGTRLEGVLDEYVSQMPRGKIPAALVATTPYLAYGIIAFGILVIVKALFDYYRVKVTERQILAPLLTAQTTLTVTEITDNANLD